jgi:hypothetical protein
MTRSALVLSLAMVIVAPATPSIAEAFYTGNTLYTACTSKDTMTEVDCLGYTSAIADAVISGGMSQLFSACVPAGVTRGQVQDIVVKWLAANPKVRHDEAAGLVAAALEDAFPCRKPSR